MRITTVSRYKVVAAMTRGFFQAFISGNVDATQPGKKEIAPLEYKKIIADNYEKLSALLRFSDVSNSHSSELCRQRGCC